VAIVIAREEAERPYPRGLRAPAAGMREKGVTRVRLTRGEGGVGLGGAGLGAIGLGGEGEGGGCGGGEGGGEGATEISSRPTASATCHQDNMKHKRNTKHEAQRQNACWGHEVHIGKPAHSTPHTHMPQHHGRLLTMSQSLLTTIVTKDKATRTRRCECLSWRSHHAPATAPRAGVRAAWAAAARNVGPGRTGLGRSVGMVCRVER
jgi:hypothetical protein